MINKVIAAFFCILALPSVVLANTYELDTSHSFIQFKASHLGIGWVVGRFNSFEGEFDYDPEGGEDAQSARIEVDTGSLDSNHAERDRHLTSDDYIDADKYPESTFVSTGFKGNKDGGTLSGILTLWGKEVPIDIEVDFSGEGDDPWGGYRAGFEGSTVLNLPDFGFNSRLVQKVEVDVYVEGVRQ